MRQRWKASKNICSSTSFFPDFGRIHRLPAPIPDGGVCWGYQPTPQYCPGLFTVTPASCVLELGWFDLCRSSVRGCCNCPKVILAHLILPKPRDSKVWLHWGKQRCWVPGYELSLSYLYANWLQGKISGLKMYLNHEFGYPAMPRLPLLPARTDIITQILGEKHIQEILSIEKTL